MTYSTGIHGAVDLLHLPTPPDLRRGGIAHRHNALFHVLQDRHVPMTQALSRKLAAFENASAPAADPFWGQGYLLAGGAIGLRGKMGNTSAWGALFATFVQVVVEPILRHVATRLGFVMVTTLGGDASAAEITEFEASSQKIDQAVGQMLLDRDQMGQAFWIAAGVTLLGNFRKPMQDRSGKPARGGARVPVLADLSLAQTVYGIEPVLDADNVWNKNVPRTAAKSKRLRVGLRPREGGVTGVQHSRRDTDIPDALSSAFILPKVIRLHKLLEEGFMIPRRPPYRRPDRDLLSMTVQIPEVADLDAAALVKAAWADAAIRLRILLANMSMVKSELGFGHMRAAGTIAAAVTAEVAQPKGRFNILALDGVMRANMISMSSLVPDLFETRVPLGTPKTEKGSATSKVAALNRLRAACAAQAGAGGRTPKAGPQKRPEMGDYAQVCLIEIAPRVVRGDETMASDWRTNRRDIDTAYDLENTQTAYLGRILCPPVVQIGASFVVCSDDGTGDRSLVIEENDDPTAAIGQIIGTLSTWIITQNILAAAHG